jgi:hypothetical protein
MNMPQMLLASAVLSAASAAAASGSLAVASAGYTYFNRPGADLRAHNRDLKACIVTASNFSQKVIPELGVVTGLFIQSLQNHQAMRANIENCMVARRWRVVRVDDGEGGVLNKAPSSELAERLAGWVGADEPHGTIARVWSNEVAQTATLVLKQAPLIGNGASLSLSALAKDDYPVLERPKFVKPDLIAKELGPKDLATVPSDAAIVVMNFKGETYSHGHAMLFGKLEPDGAKPEVLGTVGKSQVYAYRLTPGVWRIEGILDQEGPLSLCLGSPSFEVKAGEVVFAGTFDVYGDDLGPDMAMEPLQDFLAKAPNLKARLRPAVWKNGSEAPCSLNAEVYRNVYAYEMKGAQPSGSDAAAR